MNKKSVPQVFDVTRKITKIETYYGRQFEFVYHQAIRLSSTKVIDITKLFNVKKIRKENDWLEKGEKIKCYLAYLPINYNYPKHPWKWARKVRTFMVIPYFKNDRMIGMQHYYYLFFEQYKDSGKGQTFVKEQMRGGTGTDCLKISWEEFFEVVINNVPTFPKGLKNQAKNEA